MTTVNWLEYQLRWAPGVPSNPDAVFRFKRETLLPALDACHIEYAFILDEPDWVLVRVQVENDQRKVEILERLEASIKGTPLFSHITVDTWSPEKDARDRIASALGKLGAPLQPTSGASGVGWEVTGRGVKGAWVVQSKDFREQEEEFVKFITEVAGRFTLEYLRAMPRRVADRWLKSLFVHVLLDSISTNQGEEQQIREFPYI